jgi:hypothetical protein
MLAVAREEGHKEGEIKGEIRGEIKGEIKARRNTLIRLLARAGIELTENNRRRILACGDTAMLDRWVDNVLGAKTIADVLT